MQRSIRTSVLSAAILLGGVGLAAAQQTAPQPASAQVAPSTPASAGVSTAANQPVTAAAPGGASEGAQAAGKLVLLFGTGSSTLGSKNEAILDHASRLYREGRPIIMIVSGSSDAVGSPSRNLLLSQERADVVARGLLARGIPAERCQILAKGETNPAVPASQGVPESQNRRVEITWR